MSSGFIISTQKLNSKCKLRGDKAETINLLIREWNKTRYDCGRGKWSTGNCANFVIKLQTEFKIDLFSKIILRLLW